MRSPALFLALAFSSTPAAATPPEGYIRLKPGVTLESGDSWKDGDQHFRLFGVQACLRGTFYTDKAGNRRDCGEASLAVLAAYIADTKPQCAQVARSAGTVVSCYATIGADRLDLANLMISSGFAFASIDARGLPHHAPYAVVEQAAREKRVGLWRFDDVRHPGHSAWSDRRLWKDRTMISAAVRSSVVALLMTALPHPAHAADVLHGQEPSAADVHSGPYTGTPLRISGRTSLIDGRTLWFPKGGKMVRLASIDTCELPQWSYDPRRHGDSSIPKPVPCGPLAKAWLKRTVGSSQVTCIVKAHDPGDTLLGRCSVRGRDLALEMLRVGWARTISTAPAEYVTWQNYAMSARHGMWATYVLDMPEWRAKAVDRTLSRQPIADFNLLAERESEISPPFADARTGPWRVDR